MFITTVNGSYPRFPEPPRPRMLEKALEDYQLGRIDDRKMTHALERATVEAVVEMVAAGIEVVNDGQIPYGESEKDRINYICKRLNGFDCCLSKNENACDSRLSKSNVCATDQISWQQPIMLDYYRFLSERSPVEVRPVLLGPFSLARMCDPGVYGNHITRLTQDLAKALNRELEGLDDAGAKYILVEEPLLTKYRKEGAQFLECAELLCNGIIASTMLGTSGGDVLGLEKILQKSPFNGIAFDMIDGPDNEFLLTDPNDTDEASSAPHPNSSDRWGEKIIQLGLINAHDNNVETSMEIALELVKYGTYNNPGRIWVAPASGLSEINREAAFKKLTNMCQGAEWARREMARREEPGGFLNS